MAVVAPEVDRILHRPHAPFRTGTLAVDAPHELHFEECGTPDGVPAPPAPAGVDLPEV